MTHHEFKEARRKLGLSQAQLAKVIDTDPRTIRRWEGEGKSARDPNPVACQAMRWFLDGFRPPEWPV